MPGPSLRGCSLGEYPRQHYPRSHKYPTALQLPRQPALQFAYRLKVPPHMPPARRAAVPACPRFRSASPPPASPPPPTQRGSAPQASGIVLAVRCHSLTHHASGLPEESRSEAARKALRERLTCHRAAVARAATSGRYGIKCCPRHSRRFRAPIVACAAWSFLRDHLTPRPAVARGTYRFCVRKIRCSPASQNTCNHGAGESPAKPRVPGEVGWASMIQVAIC